MERPPADPELKRRIQDLIAYKGGGHNQDLVEDVIENALKLLQDVAHRGDVRVIQTAVRELRYSFKLFAEFDQYRKVTIFGSARTLPTKIEYRQAVEFARRMAGQNFMVITGAGPGIMCAGHEGAGPEKSFGVNIRLPWEQSANAIMLKDKKLINFKYFFTRKLIFIRHSDAIALFPGGFGTLDEGYEALTLMQTGKCQLMPLVLIDRPGGHYWQNWARTVREHLLEEGLISSEDLSLFQITDNVEQAVEWITGYYRNFHSTRFVKERLIIRLNSAPSASLIEDLNRDFKDIITGREVHATGPTPEEVEHDDFVQLPRIAFGFDRKSYGRLRQMIDVLNR